MKIYNEDRWDEDDACIECGDILLRESKVPGLCQDCYAETNTVTRIESENRFGTPTIERSSE